MREMNLKGNSVDMTHAMFPTAERDTGPFGGLALRVYEAMKPVSIIAPVRSQFPDNMFLEAYMVQLCCIAATDTLELCDIHSSAFAGPRAKAARNVLQESLSDLQRTINIPGKGLPRIDSFVRAISPAKEITEVVCTIKVLAENIDALGIPDLDGLSLPGVT